MQKGTDISPYLENDVSCCVVLTFILNCCIWSTRNSVVNGPQKNQFWLQYFWLHFAHGLICMIYRITSSISSAA